MKIKTGLTRKEQEDYSNYLMEWHDWFAWRPVKVGECDYRWLETVRRRKTFEKRGDIVHIAWLYGQIWLPLDRN